MAADAGAAAVPAEATAAPGADPPARRRLDAGRLAFWLGTALVIGLVAITYGWWPGSSQVPLMATYSTGMITCLHDQGLASLRTWCQATGVPVGAPPLTGLPELYVEWALSYLPGVTPWRANQILGVVQVALGVAGLLGILRRWRVPRWLALLAAVSYFLGPNLLQLNGFAHTFDGFILLPAYLYVALRAMDLAEGRWWALGTVLAVALGLLMAFTDGYSYFGGAVVIGFLALARGTRTWRAGRRARGVAVAVAALGGLAVGAVAYALWVPSATLESHPPLDFPARLGVDVTSLLVPTSRYLYPGLIGLTPPTPTTWGAADTPATHYLGYLPVLLAVVAVVVVLRRRWGVRWEVLAVAVGALATLVLAFGPTLKVGQQQPGLDASLLTLPTAFLYEHVPGFTSLRVSNRWIVTTRLCVVLLSAVGLTALWRGWGVRSRLRAGLVVLVALLALVEVLPEPSRIVAERRASIERMDFLNGGVVPEAGRLLEDGELILMLPSTNDFLADYLVPLVGVRSYNVGIDKNHSLAVSAWPESVVAANTAYSEHGPGAVEELCTVLRADDADAIVLPTVDTRSAPLLHSNDPAVEAERRAWGLQLAADPRFDAQVGDWMVVLRAADDGACSPAG